jgi:hypothetical protein
MVNRLWHYYFGRGIVATPNDYGKNGMRPSNPDLLDWLAAELVKPTEVDKSHRPWTLKRMHYLIVTSSAYRQSSEFDAGKAKVDPDNALVWRMNRKRLDAEALRDSVLATAGTLNPQLGGPSIKVPIEPEVYETIFTEAEPDNLWPVHPDPKQHVRRSLYLLRKRNVRLPMLAVFDQPDLMSSCGARGQSVHALQALTLINSPFMQEQSRALAKRLISDVPADEASRIRRLFELALNRPPAQREMESTVRFLRDQRNLAGKHQAAESAELAAWTDLCLATLNRNEFLYIG